MKEDLLYFIWKNSFFTFNSKHTVDGDLLEVINPGNFNNDSGPDFFNAKLRINKTVWAGNVEMHINSSDWYKHGHHNDSAFDNAILHVVVNDDRPAINTKGRIIPTLVIKYPDVLEWNLLRLTGSGKWISCEESFRSFDSISKSMWLSNLMVERLEQKSQYVFDLVNQTNGSWEDAFYFSVARSFGLKVNALPFELLAKATPLKVLAKHKNNLFQLESILFGQSGLIFNTEANDEYIESLIKEYQYLKHKFNLTSIDGNLWKCLRMRPTAFPAIRIAQFASLVHSSSSLFSKIIEVENGKDILRLFNADTSEYWRTHYTFGTKSPRSIKRLGDETVRVIAINSIVPFMFAYGIFRANDNLKDKAMGLLESLKPEKNNIVSGFNNLGLNALSAFESQAMVHLKTNYCDTKKCLYCHLGAKLLLKSINN
ncbi:MAG: DUF2851 family protein [Tenuifilaceae bacterium]